MEVNIYGWDYKDNISCKPSFCNLQYFFIIIIDINLKFRYQTNSIKNIYNSNSSNISEYLA